MPTRYKSTNQQSGPNPHHTAAKKPPLGTGERFAALKSKLGRRGARDPGALAAWIGRRKYGKEKFQKLSAAGKRRR